MNQALEDFYKFAEHHEVRFGDAGAESLFCHGTHCSGCVIAETCGDWDLSKDDLEVIKKYYPEEFI